MVDLLKCNGNGLRLFLLSFLILYFELALIRYTSAEVLYMGYFSNFILISVFLGLGAGFLAADKKINFFRFTPLIILLLILFIRMTHIDVTFLRNHIGQLFFGESETAVLKLPLWVSLPFILASTTLIFTGLAQEAARCFAGYPPIIAYSIDIGGSLLGILIFSLQSCFGVPPAGWFFLSSALMVLLSYRYSVFYTATMGIAVLLLVFPAAPGRLVKWSPYQRIDIRPIRIEGNPTGGYELSANGIFHQFMLPAGAMEPIYDYPYTDVLRFRQGRGYDDVLILGAGSGSDVSYALHYGVKTVDAVEIDPVIQKAGEALHPDRPYADKRVSVYISDGRAFMERTKKKYDLIIYALPDSLASLSNFANIRLETFLFTTQSFQQARNLLKPGGALILYNYYRKQWLLDKLADMLHEVFGHDPVRKIYTDESHMLLAALAIGPDIKGEKPDRPAMVSATDNWPFLYMQRPQLPAMYIWIMLMFAGCAVLIVYLSGQLTVRNLRFNGAFACMGAAFLLLETKNVIQFMLLFGATWRVNSLVFFAILVSVLLANLIVHRFDIKKPSSLFLLLLAALAAQLLLPPDKLLAVANPAARYGVASALLFSPIFFANLVFGALFKRTIKPASAFGWNIIGTTIGGVLEYFSLAIGYQALTLIVIILYIFCFLLTPGALNSLKKEIGSV